MLQPLRVLRAISGSGELKGPSVSEQGCGRIFEVPDDFAVDRGSLDQDIR